MGLNYGSWRLKNKKVRRKYVYGQNGGYGCWRFAIGELIVTKWEARLWSKVGVGLASYFWDLTIDWCILMTIDLNVSLDVFLQFAF
jgi:hypothetical protein